jgi:hypothetical protein
MRKPIPPAVGTYETFDQFLKTKRERMDIVSQTEEKLHCVAIDRVEFAEILKTKRERMDIVSQTEEKLHCVAIDVLPSDARLNCAPDLLSALERLVHPMADDDDLDYARGIIAKAKGLAV